MLAWLLSQCGSAALTFRRDVRPSIDFYQGCAERSLNSMDFTSKRFLLRRSRFAQQTA
jgi:hypothetical protein